MDELTGFTRTTFTFEGVTRDVYTAGTGPAVIVMAEMPGITPKVAAFARRVVEIGCSVSLPVLFGTPGRETTIGYALTSMVPACVAEGVRCIRRGADGTGDLVVRGSAKAEHERCGRPGVGAVGMCFTGGFTLGMMVDDRMLAPVLSQPSLPIGVSKRRRADVHLSPADLAKVKVRAQEGVCVLGMRFTGDRLVPPQRFETLRAELGDAFIGVEIDSSPGNPHGIPRSAHSVLTEHLVDEPGHPTHDALEQVLDFFRERLIVT